MTMLTRMPKRLKRHLEDKAAEEALNRKMARRRFTRALYDDGPGPRGSEPFHCGPC